MPNDDGGIAKAENGSSAAPAERRVLFDAADATAAAAAGNNEDDELLEGGNGIGAEIASLQTGGRALASAEPPESFISSSSMSGGRGSEPVEARKFTQIIFVLAVSFGCFIHGTTVSYPSVFMPGLERTNASKSNSSSNSSSWGGSGLFPDTLPFYVYDEDISLMVSIASFGMLGGSLAAGPLANLVGRKWASIFGTCGSLALGYALIPFAQYLWMLLLARFVMGAGLGFSTTLSTLYIMEVATPQMRSGLAVVPAVAGTLGVLYCQLLGALLEWQSLSLVLAGHNAPFFIMLLFIPETPVYLLGKEQIERAHKVLRLIRGKRWDVTKELTDLKVATEGREKHHVAVRDFVASSVLKPFLMALTLMFFFQFSGINIIMQYTVEIFESADSSINEYLATIFVGVALLISGIFTLLVASCCKMPRRLMLLASSFGISVSLEVMGVFYYLKELDRAECKDNYTAAAVAEKFLNADAQFDDMDSEKLVAGPSLHGTVSECPWTHTADIGWLPLALLMTYIFFFNLGYGSMIWITVAEILPIHVRSLTNSLSVAFTCVCSFFVSHTYLGLKAAMGGEGVFWLYGSISLVGFVFILVFVPETKNKTEAQIQEYFLPKSQRERARRRQGGGNGQQQQKKRKGSEGVEAAGAAAADEEEEAVALNSISE